MERDLQRWNALGHLSSPASTSRLKDVQSLAAIARATGTQVDRYLVEHPLCSPDDCKTSLQRLEHLTNVAEEFAHILMIEEEEARLKRQMEMTELSITESRSAIGCKYHLPVRGMGC